MGRSIHLYGAKDASCDMSADICRYPFGFGAPDWIETLFSHLSGGSDRTVSSENGKADQTSSDLP